MLVKEWSKNSNSTEMTKTAISVLFDLAEKSVFDPA